MEPSAVTEKDQYFIRKVNQLARESGRAGFSPFAAMLVLHDEVVATAMDGCIIDSDPTAHPELKVISNYCREQGKISLEGVSLYCSTEPCIMCSGAIHWAKIDRVVFSVSQQMLQQQSGGKQKPGCETLINSGKRKVVVVGPVLPEEGRSVFEAFGELSKKKLHHNYHRKK